VLAGTGEQTRWCPGGPHRCGTGSCWGRLNLEGGNGLQAYGREMPDEWGRLSDAEKATYPDPPRCELCGAARTWEWIADGPGGEAPWSTGPISPCPNQDWHPRLR